MRVLGIDEAGRGCVLGPLVVGGFLTDGVEPGRLSEVGATDSKRLTPTRRLEVRAMLEALGVPFVHPIPATDIDDGNLNTLEEGVIRKIVLEARPDRVILDALGPPAGVAAVLERLRAGLPDHIEWIMEPKADLNHPVVGAASIYAKTSRDAELDHLRDAYGPLGSGYPGDPATRAWLADWSRQGKPWPSFVRTRWGTIGALAQQQLY